MIALLQACVDWLNEQMNQVWIVATVVIPQPSWGTASNILWNGQKVARVDRQGSLDANRKATLTDVD
jgi:hypothetical protein